MPFDRRSLWALSAMVLFAAAMAVLIIRLAREPSHPDFPIASQPVEPSDPGEHFIYAFNKDGVLQESEEEDTSSPYWWLNSGGRLAIKDGIGATLQGGLAPLDPWRVNYSSHNPVDTDDGYHPQNVFRLVSRGEWANPRVSLSFRIMKDNLSRSPNRNETNGVFVMSRYVDGQTLYYAGLRSDGHAVIKKKYHGTYYTLAERQIFPGTYDKARAANLLPHSEWIGIESETVTEGGTVLIRLYMKRHPEAEPSLILEAHDSGMVNGTPPIREGAHIGIRTDFMDVEFEDITVMEAREP